MTLSNNSVKDNFFLTKIISKIDVKCSNLYKEDTEANLDNSLNRQVLSTQASLSNSTQSDLSNKFKFTIEQSSYKPVIIIDNYKSTDIKEFDKYEILKYHAYNEVNKSKCLDNTLSKSNAKQSISTNNNNNKEINTCKIKTSNTNINKIQDKFNYYIELLQDYATKLNFNSEITSESLSCLLHILNSCSVKNKDIDYIICSIFFYINKKYNSNISIQTLSLRLKLSRKFVNKLYPFVKNILDNKFSIYISNNNKENCNISNYNKKISYPLDIENNKNNVINLSINYCKRLELDNKITDVASNITKEILDRELLTSRTATTIASVGVFYALNLFNKSVNPKEFVSVTSSGYPTILNNYKILLKQENKFLCLSNMNIQ